MSISIEEGYALACQKIGEGIMRENILRDMLAGKDAEIAELKEKLVAAGIIEEATEIVEGADKGKAIANNGASSNGSNGGEAFDQDNQSG